MANEIITTEPQAEVSASSELPSNKRKQFEDSNPCSPPSKAAKTEDTEAAAKLEESLMMKAFPPAASLNSSQRKARETRLEQNRKAARESRRRKKIMIEDLQKSVIFFSRANGALKHQNDELTRLLMQAQAQVSVIESAANAASQQQQIQQQQQQQAQQQQAQQQQENQMESSSSVTPTMAPSSVRPSNAPSATVSTTMSQVPAPQAYGAPTAYPSFPIMQPGATMQAMASFQQAAAAAMQVAVQGMQGIAADVMAQPSPSTGSASAQQAYNDTMTALAMQQAAVAAAAVPPHLMAQIVGSAANGTTNWTTLAPAAILPATTKAPMSAAQAPLAQGPVPVAPMPSPATIAPQQQLGAASATATTTGERT